ncbi:BnaC07g13710D [Brassica napus]|uniref:(rape) hypothetical protein n=1 Tax=Brassica napus TaxID=3708 RepID=A0A078FH98_BRANA|nr:unnamed protein product [Brassica napus]CDY12531.1 BnaC07g13710D [Brassica napus]
MDSLSELPSRRKILFLAPIVPFSILPASLPLAPYDLAASSLSSLCSDPKSMRSPFSRSIPLQVPLATVWFVLVSLIYYGELRVLIAGFDLLLIGSEFICPY